jgi:hypothetical protein
MNLNTEIYNCGIMFVGLNKQIHFKNQISNQ